MSRPVLSSDPTAHPAYRTHGRHITWRRKAAEGKWSESVEPVELRQEVDGWFQQARSNKHSIVGPKYMRL